MRDSSQQDYLFVIPSTCQLDYNRKGKTRGEWPYITGITLSERLSSLSFFLSFRQQSSVNAPALFSFSLLFSYPSTQRRWNYFPSRSKQLLIWIRHDVKDNGNPSLYWQIVTRNIIRMNQVHCLYLYVCVCARTITSDSLFKSSKQQLVSKPNSPFYFQRNANYPSTTTTLFLLLRIDPQHILFRRHHHHLMIPPTCMKMIHPIISPCQILWMLP